MEFLVMPQFSGSPIECYSADGGDCTFTCNCYGDGTVLCSCNAVNCPCYDYDRCPSLYCRNYNSDCVGRLAGNAIDPMTTM